MPYNLVFSNLNTDLGLKIIDFGQAVQLEEGRAGHKLEVMQGTLEYSSPEVTGKIGHQMQCCVRCYPVGW